MSEPMLKHSPTCEWLRRRCNCGAAARAAAPAGETHAPCDQPHDGDCPPAPVPVAGLREAAQRVMDSHRKGYWSVDEFDALEAALLDSDRPGLDVERLARARHATWWECIPEVSWGSCGAVNHRLEAEQTAAEYARLQETPDDE